jgi:hypothetical protein
MKDGGRCSGDAHTSIGNALINRFLTWFCLQRLPTDSWRSVHEGDDGIIGVKDGYVDHVVNALALLPCLGFEAKIKAVSEIHQAVFCGRRFVDTERGLADVADITRSMRKFNTSMSSGSAKYLLLAKALSYNYTDGNTPLIGALTYSIIQILGSDKDCANPKKLKRALARMQLERWAGPDYRVSRLVHHLFDAQPPDVSPAKYAAVVECDNIDYRTIIDLENEYRSWIDLGYIPREFSKLQLDWVDEPSNVYTGGDPTIFFQ